VKIVFHDAGANCDTFFAGPTTMITFGKEQYQWHAARKKGYADPDGPPATLQLKGGENVQYNLPAASVTVLRGRLFSESSGGQCGP
jgi:hypothetical protein